jgi:protein involved in plasmid replication-relaxation
MTNTLQPITPKQQQIITLLYQYRFLNRLHIQALLKHKDKQRIIIWLKDLREKEYIDWHYDKSSLITKNQPAVYYITLNGIRYLRSLDGYPIAELRKRYKESTRKQTYIDRCLLMADCSIALMAKSNSQHEYVVSLSPGYAEDTDAHQDVRDINPHLYFIKAQGATITRYLLEYFVEPLPRYQLRKRLKEYIEYATNDDDADSLIVLFVCATVSELMYIKRRVRIMIDDDGRELRIRLTTLDKLEASGITSTIWEEV